MAPRLVRIAGRSLSGSRGSFSGRRSKIRRSGRAVGRAGSSRLPSGPGRPGTSPPGRSDAAPAAGPSGSLLSTLPSTVLPRAPVQRGECERASATRPGSPLIAIRLPRQDSRTPRPCSRRTRCRSWSPSSAASRALSPNCRVAAASRGHRAPNLRAGAWPEAAGRRKLGQLTRSLKRRLSPVGSRRDHARVPVSELVSMASIVTITLGADQRFGARGMHRLQVGGAAADLAGLAAKAGEQHRHRHADAGRVEGVLLLADQRLQRCSRSSLTASATGLGGAGGGGARARGVFEREGLREADIAHQRQRRLEIGVGLAGMADDEVRRQREVGTGGAQPVDQAAVGRRSWPRFIAPSMRSEPDCTGRCRNGISCRQRRRAPRSAPSSMSRGCEVV